MALHWYALRTKSRQEEAVWNQVRQLEIDVFFPRIRVHPVNPRARKLIPYFPGYIFIHVDLEAAGKSVFDWMPHTLGMVHYGGDPAIVPEYLVYAVRQRVEEINQAGGELFDGLNPGDTVKISGGPFEGYEAVFDTRIPGKDRVRILLKLINDQQYRLELDSSQITKKVGKK